jgi:ribosomal protein S27AE
MLVLTGVWSYGSTGVRAEVTAVAARHCGNYPGNDGSDGFTFPGVHRIRIRHADCRVGYAVAKAIRRGFDRNTRGCPDCAGPSALAEHIRADGKRWTCRYEQKMGRDVPYAVGRCRHSPIRFRAILVS